LLPGAAALKQVAFGNGLWIATAADGLVWRSVDTRDWKPVSVAGATSGWDILAFGQGHFVASARGMRSIWISDNGVTWLRRPNPPFFPDSRNIDQRHLLSRLIFAGNHLFACMTHDIYESHDLGETWRAVGIPTRGRMVFELVYHNGLYLALGSCYAGFPTGGAVPATFGFYVSTDARRWYWSEPPQISFRAGASLLCVPQADTLLAVGWGKAFRSQLPPPPPSDWTAWTTFHFGAGDAADADADPDCDGASNFTEYALGSNPTDPWSRSGARMILESGIPTLLLEKPAGREGVEYEVLMPECLNRQIPADRRFPVIVEDSSERLRARLASSAAAAAAAAFFEVRPKWR